MAAKTYSGRGGNMFPAAQFSWIAANLFAAFQQFPDADQALTPGKVIEPVFLSDEDHLRHLDATAGQLAHTGKAENLRFYWSSVSRN